ncbi:MAG: F0F1 ATP synthase subunit epsilon [Flavobacterium sp.]
MILEIVSPEATLFKGKVTAVSLPGVNGEFQILNHHAPIVSLLREGIVKIQGKEFKFPKEFQNKFSKVNDSCYTLRIQSGTIEMNNNKVIVLAD